VLPVRRTNRWRVVLGLAALYLIWGSTYLAIRISVETIPPFLMAGARFLTSGLALFGWALARGAGIPQRTHWLPAGVLGLLMMASNGLVAWAETTLPSGPTALMTAMAPMWIVLTEWLRPRGMAPTRAASFGLLLGFAGIFAMVNPTAIPGFGGIDVSSAFLLLLATIAWAIGSIYSRHARQPRSKLLYVGMQMMAGGAVLLAIAVLSGETFGFDVRAMSSDSWFALTYLTTVGSIAFIAYIWLLSVTSSTLVATYAYVNPVIALALGNRLAGEPLDAHTLGCATVIVLAVMIIITAKNRRILSRASS